MFVGNLGRKKLLQNMTMNRSIVFKNIRQR
jgi:hypothetical protein